jgi:hypothetical protein
MGALLTLGDALQVHRYFDHSPELELIYHLRNGVAHGNRFTFTKAGKGMVGRRVRQNGSGCVHGCATAAPPRASMPTPEHERWNEDRVARELEARYGRRHLQRAGLRFADWHRAEGFCPRGRGGWITMVTVVSGRPASEMPGPGARPAQVKKPTVVATTAAAALIFALDQREGSGGGGELW